MKIHRELSISETSSLLADRELPHNCVAYLDVKFNISNHDIEKALEQLVLIYPCLRCKLIMQQDSIYITNVNDNFKIHFNEIIVNDRRYFDDYFHKELHMPFDLLNGPLFRLSRLSNKYTDDKALIFTIHHIISDAVSIANLINIFFEIVEGIIGEAKFERKPLLFCTLEEYLPYSNINNSPTNRKIFDNINSNSLQNYTRAIRFTKEIKKIKRFDGISINANILSAAGVANNELMNSENIKFIIPVDMRPATNHKIIPEQLGFYSSWIEFEESVSKYNKHELCKVLKMNTAKSIANNEHIINHYSLAKEAKKNKPEGIIGNLINTQMSTICVSNIARIPVKPNYAEGKIVIKSFYFGLNTYLKNRYSYLLLALGFKNKVHFTLLYSTLYISHDLANKIALRISTNL